MDQAYRSAIATAFMIPEEKFPDLLNSAKSSTRIIPDDVQDELIMLRDRKRDIYFRIGDIANELILMHKGTVTAKKIYEAMSPYCDCSPRTIRYYAETADFFPPNIRDDYDILSFTHFDIARNYKGNWRVILDYALLNPQMPTYILKKQINSAIKAVALFKKPTKNPVCDSVLNQDLALVDGEIEINLAENCTLFAGNGLPPVSPPRPIARNSAQLVGSIADLSEKVIQLLDSYGDKMPEDVKDRLVEHLVGINREIPAITIALDTDGAK